MTAITLTPSRIPADLIKSGTFTRADYMPFTTRHKVAGELNRLWAEFVEDMHDGPTNGRDVAEKFWKFVLAGG